MIPLHDYNYIINLIERANKSGIKISIEDNQLIVYFPKTKEVDSEFLNELRKNKNLLLEYFESTTTNTVEIKSIVTPQSGYFDITPTQKYWVDNSVDEEYKKLEKNYGSIDLIWEVDGEFSVENFKKTISYVIRRHESLRSTFHLVDGKYVMKIGTENLESYNLECLDLSNYPGADSIQEKYFSEFKDHKFDLDKGPLFLSRLLKLESKRHIISLKIHHAISDTWSNEVLMRDILLVYKFLTTNEEPAVKPLTLQFKDFMNYFNEYREKHYINHRSFWKNLYSTVPQELVIPGCKGNLSVDLNKRYRQRSNFKISDSIHYKMNELARDYSTTLFIILQATFKSFLYCITGQNDLVIGTDVAGRDYLEMEEQVGNYARTELIRTTFENTDLLSDAIRKVKVSNEHMKEFRAYTLKDAIGELLPNGVGIESFRKIDMHFADINGFYLNQNAFTHLSKHLNLEFSQRSRERYKLIPVHMILNFVNTKDSLRLEIISDSSKYEDKDISILFNDYQTYVQTLFDNTDQQLNAPFELLKVKQG